MPSEAPARGAALSESSVSERVSRLNKYWRTTRVVATSASSLFTHAASLVGPPRELPRETFAREHSRLCPRVTPVHLGCRARPAGGRTSRPSTPRRSPAIMWPRRRRPVEPRGLLLGRSPPLATFRSLRAPLRRSRARTSPSRRRRRPRRRRRRADGAPRGPHTGAARRTGFRMASGTTSTPASSSSPRTTPTPPSSALSPPPVTPRPPARSLCWA